MSSEQIVVRELGVVDYLETWQAMKDFTSKRSADTPDEIWLLEHLPVFTQGQAGKAEHLLDPGDIPVVQSDRGGQVTYHGPGQLVVYCLLDLRRLGLGIRELVTLLESIIIEYLADNGVKAKARADAPGVYIGNAKIASVGLRVSKGCSFHGLSFNVNMDLSPFARINPCGLMDISVTQLTKLVEKVEMADVQASMIQRFKDKTRDLARVEKAI